MIRSGHRVNWSTWFGLNRARKETIMGDRIRHTKLTKTEHPYDLEVSGKKWVVSIERDGSLTVEAKTGKLRIVPFGNTIRLEQSKAERHIDRQQTGVRGRASPLGCFLP